MYVTVFADGPTRVLRFADVLDQGAEEAEQSILDLAARLRQVEEQLWRVNASFSALHGASGARTDPGNRLYTLPDLCIYRFMPVTRPCITSKCKSRMVIYISPAYGVLHSAIEVD